MYGIEREVVREHQDKEGRRVIDEIRFTGVAVVSKRTLARGRRGRWWGRWWRTVAYMALVVALIVAMTWAWLAGVRL